MITINIDKAKNIAHDKRREARSAEFAPLDIKATIPSEATAAETARQAVRDKYAAMQTAIDAATTTDEIKAAMTHTSVVDVQTSEATEAEVQTDAQPNNQP